MCSRDHQGGGGDDDDKDVQRRREMNRKHQQDSRRRRKERQETLERRAGEQDVHCHKIWALLDAHVKQAAILRALTASLAAKAGITLDFDGLSDLLQPHVSTVGLPSLETISQAVEDIGRALNGTAPAPDAANIISPSPRESSYDDDLDGDLEAPDSPSNFNPLAFGLQLPGAGLGGGLPGGLSSLGGLLGLGLPLAGGTNAQGGVGGVVPSEAATTAQGGGLSSLIDPALATDVAALVAAAGAAATSKAQ